MWHHLGRKRRLHGAEKQNPGEDYRPLSCLYICLPSPPPRPPPSPSNSGLSHSLQMTYAALIHSSGGNLQSWGGWPGHSSNARSNHAAFYQQELTRVWVLNGHNKLPERWQRHKKKRCYPPWAVSIFIFYILWQNQNFSSSVILEATQCHGEKNSYPKLLSV